MNTSAHPAAASSTLLLQEPIELDDDSLPGIAANPRAPAASCDESAPARRPGDPYRQLYRVLHDLRTVVSTFRDRLKTLHEDARDTTLGLDHAGLNP